MADGSIVIDIRLRQQKAAADIAAFTAKLEKQRAAVRELTEQVEAWEKTVAAQQRNSGSVSPAAQSGLDQARANLEAAKKQAEYLSGEIDATRSNMDKLPEDADKTNKNLKKAAETVQKFSASVASLVRRALIFTVISSAVRQLRSYVGDALRTNEQYVASMAALKGQMLALFQPIYELLVPALSALLSLLAKLTGALVSFLSMLFGQDYAGRAKALYDEAKGIKAVGSAAREAKKDLAGFDQINRLSGPDTASGGAAGAGGGTLPDFDLGIGDKVNALELLMSGALLAVGAVLTFIGGNIPLGIALMAAGAAGIVSAVATNWDAVEKELQGRLGGIMGLLSGALLVLGAVFAFSGANLALGISLMLIGAAGLATAVGVNWDSVKTALQGPLGEIVGVLAGAALVIGAVLAFSGANLRLGIGLMIAGAAGLATAVGVNWDSVKTALQGPLGEIVGVLAGAALVIGAVLAFSGANLQLGISLMVAGAVGLAATVAANWDKLPGLLEDKFAALMLFVSGGLLVLGAVLAFSGANLLLGISLMAAGVVGLAADIRLGWDDLKKQISGKTAEILAIVSTVSLVLGAVLAFSGANLPLGIALIAAGVTGLATVNTLNWDSIKERISSTWDGIKGWWQSNVAPVFTLEWWGEKFSSISEGLKLKVKDGVNGAIALFNRFVDWVNDKMSISWSGLSIGGAEIIPGGSFQLLTLPKIVPLAQGAVIPPNREFLAVLGDQTSGTNIETPLETMVEAFRLAMSDMSQAISVRVYLDGEDITNNVTRRINDSTRSGRNPLLT